MKQIYFLYDVVIPAELTVASIFFLMGMVKYECGHLGHETLSQLCLKNEPMN